MKERGFWNRYGLMLLGILLYGIDLTLIIFVTQRLYKNIVEVSFVTALLPINFVFWLMRGKEAGKKNAKMSSIPGYPDGWCRRYSLPWRFI